MRRACTARGSEGAAASDEPTRAIGAAAVRGSQRGVGREGERWGRRRRGERGGEVDEER